jgi:3-dehydroquinate synthase
MQKSRLSYPRAELISELYLGVDCQHAFIEQCVTLKSVSHCFVVTEAQNDHLKKIAESWRKELENKDIKVVLLTVEGGDQNKSRKAKMALEKCLAAHGAGRDALLVAIGGGVVLDLVAFVAATYHRGMRYLSVPTTLLAMVDVVVGGKCGINTEDGKNQLGAFKLAEAVCCDTAYLRTLHRDHWFQGWVEMYKLALLFDCTWRQELEGLLVNLDRLNPDAWLESIRLSCHYKHKVVIKDLEDHGCRNLLNFGHTMAHVIEAASNYEVMHGHAVAWGLIVALRLSEGLLGLCPKKSSHCINVLQANLQPLPQSVKALSLDDMVGWLQRDKKYQGASRFVLINELGSTKMLRNNLHSVDHSLIHQIWHSFAF